MAGYYDNIVKMWPGGPVYECRKRDPAS